MFAPRLQPVRRLCPRCFRRYSSTEPSAPPLLLKFRQDLKTAMRAKDTNRLNVLKGLLADITNASKTSAPMQKDIQILSLLRKRAAASKEAAEEFAAAKRDDLKEKEEKQVEVLEEYAGSVEMIDLDQVEEAVRAVIQGMNDRGEKPSKGSVLKGLIGPGGSLDGKPVEKPVVVRMVNAALQT